MDAQAEIMALKAMVVALLANLPQERAIIVRAMAEAELVRVGADLPVEMVQAAIAVLPSVPSGAPPR